MRHTFWCLLLAAVAMAAPPANFSGKWTIAAPAGRGGPPVLVLNQAGEEVTGSITARIDPGTSSPVHTEVLGGKVAEDTLSFYVWSGTDQPTKMTYKGTLSASGDEMALTVSGGRGGSQQLTAKRTK